ncbi:unnamed protein product, partial [Didymodactylos carnosus]
MYRINAKFSTWAVRGVANQDNLKKAKDAFLKKLEEAKDAFLQSLSYPDEFTNIPIAIYDEKSSEVHIDTFSDEQILQNELFDSSSADSLPDYETQ